MRPRLQQSLVGAQKSKRVVTNTRTSLNKGAACRPPVPPLVARASRLLFFLLPLLHSILSLTRGSKNARGFRRLLSKRRPRNSGHCLRPKLDHDAIVPCCEDRARAGLQLQHGRNSCGQNPRARASERRGPRSVGLARRNKLGVSVPLWCRRLPIMVCDSKWLSSTNGLFSGREMALLDSCYRGAVYFNTGQFADNDAIHMLIEAIRGEKGLRCRKALSKRVHHSFRHQKRQDHHGRIPARLRDDDRELAPLISDHVSQRAEVLGPVSLKTAEVHNPENMGQKFLDQWLHALSPDMAQFEALQNS
mmetsp:Transcript_23747/g.57619  ORF Transcript_23747/g.57619 Transcript_23747/m.57619 type:complete len:305 (+) Transcript_23747:356-1270(+)